MQLLSVTSHFISQPQTRYGYFRDALYYLACSEHLAFGYVDQPPLIAVIGWFTRHTLGTSLPALLLWPALAGAARIILTAAFAREGEPSHSFVPRFEMELAVRMVQGEELALSL